LQSVFEQHLKVYPDVSGQPTAHPFVCC
jgi:hypothetical protein